MYYRVVSYRAGVSASVNHGQIKVNRLSTMSGASKMLLKGGT